MGPCQLPCPRQHQRGIRPRTQIKNLIERIDASTRENWKAGGSGTARSRQSVDAWVNLSAEAVAQAKAASILQAPRASALPQLKGRVAECCFPVVLPKRCTHP